jgi:serine/threonine protein kinase
MELHCERYAEVKCATCKQPVDVSHAVPFASVPCPSCGTMLTVPARFGEFDLLQLLGQGAMGQVYLALDRKLGRQVAIKIMRAGVLKGEQELADKCLQEARALASLSHPNVAQVHYIGGEDIGKPFIVMEYVPGGRVDKLFTDPGRMDEARALEVAIDVAQGLKAVFNVGLIHGDIKPSNVLLDKEGIAKLVDFGISRFHGSVSNQPIFGTPRYVAPEVALHRDGDHRGDIFSLGVMLFFALTGEHPFSGRNNKEIVMARLENPAPSVRDIRIDLHMDTSLVVERMLKTNPDERYPDYEELITALWHALTATRAGPPEPNLAELHQAITAARPLRAAGRGRRFFRRLLRLFIFLVVLSALAAIVWLLWWGAHLAR